MVYTPVMQGLFSIHRIMYMANIVFNKAIHTQPPSLAYFPVYHLGTLTDVGDYKEDRWS